MIENATALPLNISLNHGMICPPKQVSRAIAILSSKSQWDPYITISPSQGKVSKKGESILLWLNPSFVTVFSRSTGKVWFTIEVRLHLGPASEYNKWSVGKLKEYIVWAFRRI